MGVVAAGELGQRSGGPDRAVVGVEGGVDDQTAVEHQRGVVNGLESLVVHAFTGEAKQDLEGFKCVG